MKKSIALVLLMVSIVQCLCLRNAFAGRPLSTDDAWTVEKGQFQLETGFDFTRQDNRDGEISPSLGLSYGLLEIWTSESEVRTSLFGRRKKKTRAGSAMRRLSLNTGFWVRRYGCPRLRFSGKVKIPTAGESKGLGSGKGDFGLNAIFSKELSKRFVLHLSLGYTFIGEHGASNGLNYSGAGQFILSDKWALVGEVTGVNNMNGRRRDAPLSCLLGTYYLLTDKIIWDAGVSIGLNKAAPDYRITTGLTVLFKP